MKILIIGARGMLGTDLCMLLGKKYDTTGIDIEELDITRLDDTVYFIKNYKPALIINCAAITNVDGCETEVDRAYLVNAIGARNLAVASNETGAPLIHYSTDYVFDGAASVPYTEFDKVNPQSVYGKSKLAGEEYVKSLTNRYFIIRTQWLYGKNGLNFVKTIMKRAAETGELKVVNDQTGKPTYTKDLAAATQTLLDKSDYGIYHITNSGIVSWYEFTAEILKAANLKNVKLTPCTTEEFPRPAKRPMYAPLENYCLKLAGLPEPRSFKEALKHYIKESV